MQENKTERNKRRPLTQIPKKYLLEVTPFSKGFYLFIQQTDIAFLYEN